MGSSWVFSLVLHEVSAAALLLLGLCVLMIFARRFVHKNAALAIGGLATAAALYFVIKVSGSCGAELRCEPPPANADPRWWVFNILGFQAYLYVTYVGPLFVASCVLLTWAFWRRAGLDASAEGDEQPKSSESVERPYWIPGTNPGMTKESGAASRMESRDTVEQSKVPSWWEAGTHQEGLVFANVVRAVHRAGTWLTTTEGGRAIAAIVTVNVIFPLFYVMERAAPGAFALPQVVLGLVFIAWLFLINGLNFWFLFRAPKYRSLFGVAILLNVLAYFGLGALSFAVGLYNFLHFYAVIKGFGVS